MADRAEAVTETATERERKSKGGKGEGVQLREAKGRDEGRRVYYFMHTDSQLAVEGATGTDSGPSPQPPDCPCLYKIM